MDRRLACLSLLSALIAPAVAVAGEEKKKKSGGASYMPLDTITATVVRADGRRGVLTVETGVDIPDNALRAKAEKLMPRIRAGFVQIVQVYAAGLPAGAPPNVDYISRELQRQTDAALGARGARLLLGTVMVN